ncbi:CHASE2 domain-containing protein [Lusitaniella coriacea LEGE 07157]|uniref:CHASE2 domain-containing protein n=1 Tax=Lusitaniella coriacea LEGE 07157 TaxID=945747 RepID=A0A8J7DW28_9CYAN|nr:CHASE2 domain-containing protein [Lusitaniella coriacea]MBE9116196.1 CHASE2 domain-containing protein [Lusitaniella coriacea LEGE 07157]
MSQLVVLNFGEGSWKDGFPSVTARLWENENRHPTQFTGRLPPAPQLPELYQQWRALYQALSERLRLRQYSLEMEIEFEEDGTPDAVSDVEFEDLCKQLKQQLNRWLDSGFGRIERQLRAKLSWSDEIRIILEVEDEQLRQLPWHLWNFFEDFPKAEIALSTQEYESVPLRPKSTKKVRILAILGNALGIDLRSDRALLEKLPYAETVFLVEPTTKELHKFLWDERGWDILFFAGHSSSRADGATGQLEINGSDSLTIPQLRHALTAAIDRGLQLAIFNSCDGLGLARELGDLDLPQLIVMREPVPDLVAQEFLKNFLTTFSGGNSFYLAVREAREKLQGLEKEFPCACWLPLICQNPTATPPTWWELCNRPTLAPPTPLQPRKKSKIQLSLGSILAISLIIAGSIVGLRSLGLLEPIELKAFDRLMRLRPDEGPDPRLLLITVTGTDVQAQPAQERKSSSLSNNALEQLLDQLDQYEPRVVGLDIYRAAPVEPKYNRLIERFRNDDRFINVCKVADDADNPGIPPPNPIPKDKILERVGFSDVVTDPDGILRRHLLALGPPRKSLCQTQVSLSLQVALRYLADEGMELELEGRRDLRIQDTLLLTLDKNSGGYHHLDAGGFQIPLNYRSTDRIAPQLTLAEALEGNKLTPELVRDRIVLIGTTDKTFRDLHHTPYDRGYLEYTPGVIVQAHAIGQILGAVLDERPLLWWWSKGYEALWICGWSIFGGLVVWRFKSAAIAGFTGGLVLIALCGSCYVLLVRGGWIPLIPPAFAVIATIGTVSIYQRLS